MERHRHHVEHYWFTRQMIVLPEEAEFVIARVSWTPGSGERQFVKREGTDWIYTVKLWGQGGVLRAPSSPDGSLKVKIEWCTVIELISELVIWSLRRRHRHHWRPTIRATLVRTRVPIVSFREISEWRGVLLEVRTSDSTRSMLIRINNSWFLWQVEKWI